MIRRSTKGLGINEIRARKSAKLRTDEVLVLRSAGKSIIQRLIAWEERRGLGDSVVIGTPLKLHSVASRSVESKRNISKHTLSRCNNDNMCSASTVAALSRSRLVGCTGRREILVISHALWK